MRDLTLSDLPYLSSLSASKNAPDRQVWLRVVADYFAAMRPNDREGNDRFAEILIARLEASEPVTQLDIARRLATCPETPRTLLEWFTREESLACDFLLEHGAGLTEADLGRAVHAACGVPRGWRSGAFCRGLWWKRCLFVRATMSN